MPGPIGKAADQKVAEKAKSKRGRREDSRMADLAKVQLTAEAPVKPKGLDKVASQHWDDCVKLLLPLRLLTPLDGACLEAMCRAYSIKTNAEKKIAKCMVKEVSGGGERISSWGKVAKDWGAIYDKYADKFGLNPYARSKMRLPLPKVKDNGANQQTNRSRYYGNGV